MTLGKGCKIMPVPGPTNSKSSRGHGLAFIDMVQLQTAALIYVDDRNAPECDYMFVARCYSHAATEI